MSQKLIKKYKCPGVKFTHTDHSQNIDLLSKKFCPFSLPLFTKNFLLSKTVLSDTLNIHSPQSSISTAVLNQASYKVQYCNECGSLKTQRRQSSVLLCNLFGFTARTIWEDKQNRTECKHSGLSIREPHRHHRI